MGLNRRVFHPWKAIPAARLLRAAAGRRVANAERSRVDQHEGEPRRQAAAIDPGMMGTALNHDVAAFRRTVESSESMSISPAIPTTWSIVSVRCQSSHVR
jgi:hypothetical protein